jgi:hypothetical protein
MNNRQRSNAADRPEPTPNEEAKRPVHEVRLGRIKAAIWENETENGTRHSVTITRLYKTEGDPTWRTTTSFNRDDLPLVAKVADMAHTYIFGLGHGDNNG